MTKKKIKETLKYYEDSCNLHISYFENDFTIIHDNIQHSIYYHEIKRITEYDNSTTCSLMIWLGELAINVITIRALLKKVVL